MILLIRSCRPFTPSTGAMRRISLQNSVVLATKRTSPEGVRLFSSSSHGDEQAPSPPPLIIDGHVIKYAMAPMVAASDYPFRKLVRKYAENNKQPILCYTQMLHAKNVVNDVTFRAQHVDFVDNLKSDETNKRRLLSSQQNSLLGWKNDQISPYLERTHIEGGPLMVQLAGSDPDMVVEAAQIILATPGSDAVSGFDLNCGCPQHIARKGGYGAFLMEQDDDLVCEILKQLKLSLPSHIAVSAKIRLPVAGTDKALKERITKLVSTTGIDFLTIHGRTLKENKGLVAACHFDKIKRAIEIAQAIRPDFPVIANGGVEHYDSLEHVLEQTGASAVMSSEALLEMPNIFAEPTADGSTPAVHLDPNDTSEQAARAMWEQQLTFARDYIDLCARYPPLPGVLSMVGGTTNVVRGHMFKLLHRYLQDVPAMRNKLSDQDQSKTLQDLVDLLDELERRYNDPEHGIELLTNCTKHVSTWYKRHRDSGGAANMHRRTAGTKQEVVVISVEERKRQMQERIQKLRAQKEEKRLVA
jgi:tRNA-dihydrouridine synthase 1